MLQLLEGASAGCDIECATYLVNGQGNFSGKSVELNVLGVFS